MDTQPIFTDKAHHHDKRSHHTEGVRQAGPQSMNRRAKGLLNDDSEFTFGT